MGKCVLVFKAIALCVVMALTLHGATVSGCGTPESPWRIGDRIVNEEYYDVRAVLTNGVLDIWGDGYMRAIYENHPWSSRADEIREIVIRPGVRSTGAYAFMDVKNLIAVSFPSTMVIIESSSFVGCDSLVSVTIPEGLKNIRSEAFADCGSLEEIEIPSTVQSISPTALSRCNKLQTIYVSDANATYMSEMGCLLVRATKELVLFPAGSLEASLPQGTLLIGENAIAFNTNLVSIVVPEGVTEIKDRAFEGCRNLRSVALPATLVSIGESIFLDCSLQTNVVVNAENEKYQAQGGCLIDHTSKTLVAAVGGIVDAVIPSGVINIGDRSFAYCSNLRSVEIPDTVVTIGDAAFLECEKLSTVFIPENVQTIGIQAFIGCTNVQSLTILSKNLSCKTSPYETTYTFEGVDSITLAAPIKLSTLFSSRSLARIKHATVLPSVTTITDSMFKSCSGLTEILLPDSIENIGEGAFNGCSSLTNVIISGQAPMAGTGIFNGTPENLVVHTRMDSSGWVQWCGRRVSMDIGGGLGSVTSTAHSLTVTNVVLHYIMNSIQPTLAVPTSHDTGFVNVITEVRSSGVVTIPEAWSENYPGFVQRFGADFGVALGKTTGKRDGSGNAMLVWQDYVAGTDPTNPNDTFVATVTIVEGKPVVSWTPELSAEHAALRKYTTYGKAKLQDAEWSIVNGDEANYNFFKVTVEMR